MQRYLIISVLINLFLFFLYGYWLGNHLKNTLELKKIVLPPLQVKVAKIEERKEEHKSSHLGLFKPKLVSQKTSVENAKSKSKGELLSTLLPEVEEEVQTFRKIVTTAKASYKGKKFEMLSSRKLVYVPPVKPLKVSYPPSPVEVKITVLPDGRVINAVLIKKSGNPKVDKFILNIVRNLKFEKISEPIIQEIYLEINFRL